MNLSKRVLAILIPFLLVGCMAHGDTPYSYGPDSFTTKNSNPEINLSEYPWWKDLGSEELNLLVENGLNTNKKLSLSIKAIESAQSSLDTVKLGWLPVFSFVAGRAQGNTAINLPNLPIPIANTGGFAAFLPLWIANIIQLPNQIKEAKKGVEVTASDYLALRTVIATQIVSSYTVLLATIEEESILLDLEKDLKERLDINKSMSLRGITTQISVADMESELNKLKAQIHTNKSNRLAARNALLILVGQQVSDFKPTYKFSDLKIDNLAPGNTPTSVLSVRPDVVAARAKIEASDYGVSSAISNFAPIPTFTTANARITSSNNGIDSSANANMQAGLALWVLDPKFIGLINSKNKMYEASVINYLSVVDNAIKDVDDNLNAFEASKQKLILDEKSLNNSGNNLNVYKAMYKNGILSYSQYLEFRSKFNLARIAILQSKVQSVIDLSKLYQSMGGGATYREKNYTLSNQEIKNRETDYE